MARDTQRNRIYRAETAYHTLGLEPLWKLEKFVADIQRRAWWKHQQVPPVVIHEYSYNYGCIPDFHKSTTDISLHLPDELTRIHVLHRLAHVLMGPKHSASDTPHDPEFVKMYLELMRRFYIGGGINEDVKREFKKALRAENVKTKVVSEETKAKQRAAMVKRMTPTEDDLLATLRTLEEL